MHLPRSRRPALPGTQTIDSPRKTVGSGQHLTVSLWTSSCTTSSAVADASVGPLVAFTGDKAVCTDGDRRRERWGAEMGAVLPGLDPLHCAVLDIMPCRAGLGAERLPWVE